MVDEAANVEAVADSEGDDIDDDGGPINEVIVLTGCNVAGPAVAVLE